MMRHVFHTGAEPASRVQTDCHRTNQDVDFRGLCRQDSVSIPADVVFKRMSCRLTGTPETSVTPRPCLPTIPKE